MLHHENIATVVRLWQSNGIYYIAWSCGGPYARSVSAIAYRGGCDPAPDHLREILVSSLCDALDHAHNLKDGSGRPLRLIHLDVSPRTSITRNTARWKLMTSSSRSGALARSDAAGYIEASSRTSLRVTRTAGSTYRSIVREFGVGPHENA